ncbi:MAG: hypothetical protein K0S65_3774 [Labilithrix sp.]|nr:hypothetical protein [Labilithrix sp.]
MEATTKTTESSTQPEAGGAPTSSPSFRGVVDDLFDVLTAQTVKGLVATRDALEVLARWIDDRAKVVGELATKLSTAPSGSASP